MHPHPTEPNPTRHWEELTRHCCGATSSSKGHGGIDPSSPKFTFEDMMRYRYV